MKTFTNYAEKKAKQFLNLLQGYTKGIRTTAILILLLMGVSNAWGETVLFLKNTIPFNNGRYAYFYNSNYWNADKGAGSNNIASQCNSMTKLGRDGQYDIYVYQTSSNYKYVAIMDHDQNMYEYFWETQGCAATYDDCDGLYDIKKPMMIPTSTNPFKKNEDKTQYYHFSWDVPTVWIKHPFGGGEWSYKQMTYNNDGTFSVDAEYSNGKGCNYGCSSGNDNGWIESPQKTPDGTWSHLARFKMTFSGGSVNISITKLCTVTFHMNDHGSAIDAQNVLYQSKATQPSNPTASGYTFGGWYTDQNCTSAFDFNTEITDDITLYAKWTQQYVIVGSGNGTSNSDEMGSWLNGHSWIDYAVTTDDQNIIQESKTYNDCPAGIKNFRIVPWGTWDNNHGKDQLTDCNVPSYTNQDNNIAFVTVAKADITIGFDGTNITVNVAYDQDDLANVKNSIVTGEKVMFYFGDEWGVSDYKCVKDGGANVVTATKGFLLNGVGADKWLSVAILPPKTYNISNSSGWEGLSTNEVVQAGAIYACYNDGSNKIRKTDGILPCWTKDNATITKGEVSSGLSATCGNSSVGRAQTITDYYYQLEGGNTWTKFDPNNVSDLPIGIYKVHALAHDDNIYVRTAEPATLTIHNEYTITYKDQGGSNFSGTHEEGYPTTHTYGSETPLKNAGKKGYTFLGWHKDAECTQKVTTLGATAYTGNITLYAKWEIRNLYIHADFINNWGEGIQVEPEFTNNNVVYTYTGILEAIPSRQEGDAWNYGHHFHYLYSLEGIANPETQKKAYNYNNVDGENITYTEGIIDGVHKTADNNPTIQFGLTKKSRVTITLTLVSDIETNEKATQPDVAIVAIPCYTITLNQTGGTGGTTSVTAQYGENLPAITIPSRDGYTFAGYYDQQNGQGTQYYNADGTSAHVWDKQDDATLYAKWIMTNYTITYNLDGGTNHADNPTNYTIETPTITLKDPTKTGYKFNGWYSEAGFNNPVTQIATGSTGDKTLYAKWTEIISTVTVTTDNTTYGTLKFDSTPKDWGTPASVGVSTSQTITATANEGYKFVQWELSGSATSDSPLTNATITLKSNGTGIAGTATAVFAEDLNSSWHLVGDDGNVFPNRWKVHDNNMMKKRSGSSSEKKVYMTITVSDINNINKPYEFKVVDDNGDGDDKWYGYSNDSYLTWTGTSEKTVYQSTKTENTKNLKFTPNAVGNYVFQVDYSGTDPKVTITYPELGGQSIYLYGEFNDWKANDQYKFEEENGLYILKREFTKRERFEALKTSQAEYEFKLNINGTNYTVEGNGNEKVLQYTRQNTTKVVNDGNNYQDPSYNLLLQADFTGDYIFTYDPKTQKLTVTHPTYSTPASYIVGDFSDEVVGTDAMPKDGGAGKDWTETYGQPLENGVGCIELGKNSTWHFKIKINGIWYGADIDDITTSGTYTLDDDYADTGEKNVTIITTNEDGCYYFEYTLNNDGTLSVLIIFPNDRRTVTFDMQGQGTPVDEQHVLYRQTAVKPYVSDVEGYLFAGWYTDAACSIGKEYDFNTPVTQDITLYAKWIPYGDCIFYKNNLNWDEVYVYFYSSDKYWDNDKGTGAYKDSKFPMNSDHRPYYREFRGKMTRIGLTDIWYFDYISAAKQIDPTYWAEIKGYKNIAFTAHEQHNHSFFDNTKVIRRGDFNQQLPLFIPQTDQTPTDLNKHNGFSAKYYNNGLWMKYNNTYSGYDWSGKTADTDWSNTQLTSDLAGRYSFTAEVKLNAGKTYEFKIKNLNNTWFGNTGTMTQDNCTNWWFTENTNNAKITPTINGTYIFTVYLGDGKVMVSLDYPLSVGDYRLAYKDNQADSFHPGHYIKKRTNVEEKRDTVSFFIHKDKSPQILLQHCSAISNDGTPTWQTDETYTSLGNAVNSTTVYNFILKQTNINSTNTPSVETSETHLYTGDYYIRTDAAAGGWKSFRQEDNKMTYSSYADNNEDFDHYFCEWITANRNVKFTIANDYSYCISDTTDGDNIINKKGVSPGCLPADANVRFGWDSKTNQLRRAYIAGSGHKKDRFLVLEGNESLRDVNDNRFTGKTFAGQDRFNLTDDEVVFDDMGNWIYQIDVKANKDTKIDLTALYNGKVQYFKGGSEDKDDIPLIVTTNDNEKYYKIRIIYDFKTNHLISAWLPDNETITTNEQLGADMMIIRRNQEKAEQLKFNPLSSSLTEVGTAYAVITFDKYFLNNKNSETGNPLPQAEEKSANERKFYWISFPFDVRISDVFGFGEYGDYWIMEYYDGEARAKEGYWAETETFWKYITNKNYVLKAGQGYVLYLNLNKMGYTSPIFAHTDEVNLYFPSASPLNVITGELPTAVQVPAHECTIQRDKRNIYDSNWNLIGVPGFADIENVSIGGSDHQDYNDEIQADCVSFYYKYLPATNTYSATTQNETFQTMYAYMVQFAGTINWQAKTMPAQLAARRTGSTPSQYALRLEIAQGEQTDQTFVQLKEEDATAEFDMNVDMTKIFNSGMNIYTLTGSNAIQVAGNALPIAKATIPVGVVTATAGEYTFRMPDGTDGIAVTLVDNVTGTHTNMLMNEYTVTLHAGTIENRFYLVVDPDRTATSVENVGSGANGDEAKGVEKFLIDGKLFIRTADGIFDAKGQRL